MSSRALISNLNAGRVNKTLKRVQYLATQNDILHYQTASLEEAEKCLMEVAEANTQTLIINGGDGTVDEIIRLILTKPIFKKPPNLVLLSGGTTNMTHMDLGWSGNPSKAFKKFLTPYEPSSLKHRSVMKITSRSLDRDEYGFFFGMGLIPKAIKKSREKLHSKGLSGKLAEALMLVSLFWRLKVGKTDHEFFKPNAVKFNGADHSYIFLFATTLQSLLLGLKPFHFNNNIAVAGVPEGYKDIAKIFKVEKSSEEGWHFNDRQLELSFDGEWTMDGALFHSTKDQPLIITLDKQLSFIVPE